MIDTQYSYAMIWAFADIGECRRLTASQQVCFIYIPGGQQTTFSKTKEHVCSRSRVLSITVHGDVIIVHPAGRSVSTENLQIRKLGNSAKFGREMEFK